MTVRELVYGLLSTDPELISLGFRPENTFANGAPLSPPDSGAVWAVLNWGPETPGLSTQRGRDRASSRDCTVWWYTRDSDYGVINAAIKRWTQIMDSLESRRTGLGSTDGWVWETEWQGDGVDGWDDIYRANFRTCEYTIMASGD